MMSQPAWRTLATSSTTVNLIRQKAALNKVGEVKDERINKEIKFLKALVAAKMVLAGMPNAKANDAATMLKASLTPDSHHAYQAAELMGDLAMSLGRPDGAVVYYNQVAQAPFPELKALAAYKLGDVALASNKLPEARKQFEMLLGAKATDAETTRLRSLAEVGLAVCEAKEGKSKEALAKLQELVKTNDSTDQALFARISNAMGAVL